MRTVLVAKDALATFVQVAERDEREHGGVFFGDPVTGDGWAFSPAPDDTPRSPSFVTIDAGAMVEAARAACERQPGAALVGFGHKHDDLPEPSRGDLEMLARLHRAGLLAAHGLLFALAVRRRLGPTEVLAWWSRHGRALEEVELLAVEDPVATRQRILGAIPPPRLREHALAGEPGARRFVQELAELEGQGFAVQAGVRERGVEVTIEHPDRRGALRLLIPSEGWERPPRVCLEQTDGRQRSLSIYYLAQLGAAWSSAYSLGDAVEFVIDRRLWPNRTTKKTTAKTGAPS